MSVWGVPKHTGGIPHIFANILDGFTYIYYWRKSSLLKCYLGSSFFTFRRGVGRSWCGSPNFPNDNFYLVQLKFLYIDCEETKGCNPHLFKNIFLRDLGTSSHPTSITNFEKIPSLLFSAIRANINFWDKVVTSEIYVSIKSYKYAICSEIQKIFGVTKYYTTFGIFWNSPRVSMWICFLH